MKHEVFSEEGDLVEMMARSPVWAWFVPTEGFAQCRVCAVPYAMSPGVEAILSKHVERAHRTRPDDLVTLNILMLKAASNAREARRSMQK